MLRYIQGSGGHVDTFYKPLVRTFENHGKHFVVGLLGVIGLQWQVHGIDILFFPVETNIHEEALVVFTVNVWR